MNQLTFANSADVPFASGYGNPAALQASRGPSQDRYYLQDPGLAGLSSPSPANGANYPAQSGWPASLAPEHLRRQHQQPYAATSLDQQPNAFAYSDLTEQQSASPAPHYSPNVGGQQQNFTNTSTPPTRFPMAAPPLPPSPANAQPPNQAAVPTPPAPQSPAGSTTTSRDHQRITLLLEINQQILAEIQRLQGEDQGGAITSQQAMALKQSGQADKMASDDYRELLRRLQGNLAYMTQRSGQQQINPETRVLPGPLFMQHPPQMPQLAEKYEELRELFPGWPGNDARLMASSAAGGAGSPTQATSMQQRMLQMSQQQQMQQQQMNANGVARNVPNMMQ